MSYQSNGQQPDELRTAAFPTPHLDAPTSSRGSQRATDSTVKEQASNLGHVAKDAGAQVAAAATEQAKTIANEAGRQAHSLLAQAGGQLRQQAGSTQAKAVGGLRSFGDELRALAEGSAVPDGIVAPLAAQAASKTHDLASWLDAREPADIVDDVRTLARRNPGPFLLVAAIAGVAAGRLARGTLAARRAQAPEVSGPLHSDTIESAQSDTAAPQYAASPAPSAPAYTADATTRLSAVDDGFVSAPPFGGQTPDSPTRRGVGFTSEAPAAGPLAGPAPVPGTRASATMSPASVRPDSSMFFGSGGPR
jgi:hypothetical protein